MSAAPADDPLHDPALARLWLDDSHDLLALTDTAGLLLWANTAFERATRARAGVTLSSLLSTDPAEPMDAETLRLGLADALLEDRPLTLNAPDGGTLRLRARTRHRGGRVMWTLADRSAEHALAEQLERQSVVREMIQEFMGVGVWERDLATGQGTWDPHVFAVCGLDPAAHTPTREEVIALIQADDAEPHWYERSFDNPGRYSHRHRIKLPDGRMRWTRAEWQVFHTPQGQPQRVIGILIDDTERRQLTRSLSDASELLQLAVQLGEIGIWRHDLATDLFYYSERAATVFGLPPRRDGVPISEVRSLIHPDDLPRVLVSVRQALESTQPTDLEARYRRPAGRWADVMTRRVVERDPRGKPMGFVGVALDVSARVSQHRKALELARQLDIATTEAGIGIWNRAIDSEEPHWNAQMYRLLGRSPALPPPRREEWLNEMVHPDDRERMRYVRERLLGSPTGFQETEYRIVRGDDGEVRWLTHRTSIETWEGQRMVFGVVMDTTDRRNAELARQQKALAERENQAKSQFLARMSHELRTPLNAVLGFTQLLQIDDEGISPKARQAQLAHIRTAGEHLLALINDALDLTTLESGKLRLDLEPIDIAAMVAETVQMMQPMAQHFRVKVHVDEVSGTVRADRIRLRQVLINLMSNAIKYNRPHGRVLVQTETLADTVALHVCDTGRGLTAEQLAHLFEPFNRLGIEPEGIEGSGIGLVIVKALVESMGGTVAVSSVPKVRTVFTLRLPRCEAAPPVDTPPPAATARHLERSGLVLYIEDNAVNVMLIEELVASLSGLSIRSAATGTAGVAMAEELRPDLVLIDMELPDIDGYEVLRRLHASPQTAQLHCVALSANAMPKDIATARQAGFADYWTKPIDVVRFMDALEALFPPTGTDTPPP